jgi:hypothetical protein
MAQVPVLTGRLTDAAPSDVVWIARAVSRWHRSSRWSYRGATPNPGILEQLLVEGVAAQQVVVTGADDAAALLQVVNVRPGGYGFLEMLGDPERAGAWHDLVPTFVERVASERSLRKLLLAFATDELVLPPWVEVNAAHAGRLVQHERRGPDAFADVDFYEIWIESEPGE